MGQMKDLSPIQIPNYPVHCTPKEKAKQNNRKSCPNH